MRTAVAVLIVLLVTYPLAGSDEEFRYDVDLSSAALVPGVKECSDPIAVGDHFDYKRRGPVEFLATLCASSIRGYVVCGRHRDWIKKEHIPALVEKLDSTDPCPSVRSTTSSIIEQDMSTVGNEAAFLIEGYRRGQYPPHLSSLRPRTNIEVIKAWWKERGDGV